MLGLFKKNTSESYRNYSYSQSGEDIIVYRILKKLNIENPTYLDIGANHPVQLNNTYKLYEAGSTGVLIEPNPLLIEDLAKARSRDNILNIGVGINKEENLDFYILTNKFLSTFSKEEADKSCSKAGNKIEKIVKIRTLNINKIIQDNFLACPNFVSLDIEGLDFEIIKTFDFTRFKPEVFCIETIKILVDREEEKDEELIDYMKSKGYMSYSDTYINTIFVDKLKWESR